MEMTTWLVSGLRTPFARVDGPLRRLDSVALSVPVAKAMAAQLPRGRPDLVVWGTVAPNLGWSNIARELVIDAGIDPATPAVSTVLACSTSMVAVFEAAGMLRQDLSVALCGGVESMSRVQIGLKQGFSDWMRRFTQARSFGERVDRVGEFRWKDFGLHIPSVANRATGKSMGEHCEEMAKQWKIARADQDRIALQSHQRAVKAMASGFFDDLVMAVEGMAKDGIPRADSSAEKLAFAQARLRSRQRPGQHHRGQRLPAHGRRGGDLGGERRGPFEAAGRSPPRAPGGLGDRGRRYLSRRPADGARLRHPAPSRPQRAHARRDRPLGDPRSVRCAGPCQRGRGGE
jgi:acetyl-CoA acetyltransferase